MELELLMAVRGTATGLGGNALCPPNPQADWPRRYDAACDAARSLQQRLDEARRGEREEAAATTRLRARLLQAEEALQARSKEADDKDAQRRKEHQALQDVGDGATPMGISTTSMYCLYTAVVSNIIADFSAPCRL